VPDPDSHLLQPPYAGDTPRGFGRNVLVLGAATLVLALAVGLVLTGMSQRPPKFTGEFGRLVPGAEEAGAWQVKDLPIAETPEAQRMVDELLNFDQAVYRTYAKGDRRISIYLAYWRPGKMQPKDIGRHTPDSCWVLSGWKRTHMATREDLRTRDGGRVRMTEHRTFVANGQTEHVAFWHVIEEATHSYRTGGRPPWHWLITDSIRRGLNQKPEQFFLRISSNRPLEDFWTDELVQGVVSGIPGIVERP
jgi:hypothetical protein